jgi:hypothetical protein
MHEHHGHGQIQRQTQRLNTPPAVVLPSPSAFFGGVRNKGQLTYNIKTTPKAPKANGTMTVTLKARGGWQAAWAFSPAAPAGRGESVVGVGGFGRAATGACTKRPSLTRAFAFSTNSAAF